MKCFCTVCCLFCKPFWGALCAGLSCQGRRGAGREANASEERRERKREKEREERNEGGERRGGGEVMTHTESERRSRGVGRHRHRCVPHHVPHHMPRAKSSKVRLVSKFGVGLMSLCKTRVWQTPHRLQSPPTKDHRIIRLNLYFMSVWL